MSVPIFEEAAGYHCLTRISPQTTDLALYSCGTQKCPPGHSFGPAARPEYHLHVVMDGTGCFQVHGQTWHLKRGSLFLCPPNTEVYYCASTDDPWYYAWISFHGTKAESILNFAGFNSEHLIRSCNIPPESLTALIQKMLQVHQQTQANELRRIGYLYRFLSLLISSGTASPVSDSIPSDLCVGNALQYISANYNTQIQITDIADYVGVHRSYLYSLFKEKMGQSPQQYLLAFRMEKARSLLADASTSVKEVARLVGYRDAFSFSKAFHRFTGKSPSEYRSISAKVQENESL